MLPMVVISMTNAADYGYGLIYDANPTAPYYCQTHTRTYMSLHESVHEIDCVRG